MIIEGTKLRVFDNSGEKEAYCIRVLKSKKVGNLGDEIVVVGLKSRQVYRGIIVQTRKETKRIDGSRIKFKENGVVLLDKKGNLVGTRVTCGVINEIGQPQILSAAKKIL